MYRFSEQNKNVRWYLVKRVFFKFKGREFKLQDAIFEGQATINVLNPLVLVLGWTSLGV